MDEKTNKTKEARLRWLAKNPDYHKAWREKNKDKTIAATKKWREGNREKYLEAARQAYHRRDPEHVSRVNRARRLKQNYNMTPDEFDAMLTAQGNRCAICEASDPTHTNWVVDHHHATGKVRGILCSPCNVALRKDRDTVEHLRRALKYIEQFESTLSRDE
jgi:predicted TIM-barrel fold metal-dependent hydrolase